MESAGIDWSRFDTEEAVRGLNEEEREKRLGEISTIMKLEGKINELRITLEIIKRQEDKKQKKGEREEDDVRKVMREMRGKEKKKKKEEEQTTNRGIQRR